jgi:hypothetical protein
MAGKDVAEFGEVGGDDGIQAGLGGVFADDGPGRSVPAGPRLAENEFRVSHGEQRAKIGARGSQLVRAGVAVHGRLLEVWVRRNAMAPLSDGGNPVSAEIPGSGSGIGWPSLVVA